MISERGLIQTNPSIYRVALLFLAAVLVAAAAGSVLWRRAQSQAVAPSYQTAKAAVGTVTTTVTATGPVSAAQSIPLSFKNSGKILRFNVQIGDTVKAGQVLAQQDTTDLQNALNQAKATLAQQQAAMSKLKQGASSAAIAVGQSTVDANTQALENAKKNLAIVQATNATDLATAQVGVQNDQVAVSDAQKNVTTVQAQIAAARQADDTNVANAQTALDNAKKNLTSVQDQVTRNTASDQTAVANAQTSVTNAQKALQGAQQAAVASQAVQAQNIAKAKNDLYAAQITRDADCNPRNSSATCQVGNAQVNSAQTAVDAANAATAQTLAQSQQSIQSAQAAVDSANASLKTAQDALQANLAKYQGSIVAAQTQVDQATGALKTAQDARTSDQAKNASSLASAQQSVDQASATLKTAQATLNGTGSKEASATQSAQASVDQAQSALNSAQASLAQTKAPATQADVDAAQAQIDNAEQQVKAAQANIDGATITAPIDGTISAINGSVGQEIAGGATGATTTTATSTSTSSSDVITLTDLNALQVTGQVNESDMASLKVGDPVTFTISAFPNETFQGKVAYIQPQGTTSQNVVNYSVTSTIDNSKVALLPGMTANETITTAQQQNVLTVPASALSYGQSQQTAGGQQAGAQRAGSAGGASGSAAKAGTTTTPAQAAGHGTVVVLNQGKQTVTSVTVGLNDGKNAAITSGLNAGDQVITGVSTGAATKQASASGQGQPSSIGIGGLGR